MGIPFQEFDQVEITGRIVSEPGAPNVTALRCTIATIEEDRIKAWPIDSDDPQLPASHDGKLWFVIAETTIEIYKEHKSVPEGRRYPKDSLAKIRALGPTLFYWVSFARWSTRSTKVFIYSRIYHRGRWTPFVKVAKRYRRNPSITRHRSE